MPIHERQIRDRERRRQQIIAASKRVFVAKGVSKATIKDIAAEAELSPGTLYIYFKNKDELYSSLSIRMLKHLSLRLQRVKERQDFSHTERIAAVKEALCDAYEMDPPVFIALMRLQASEMLENISPDLLDQILGLSRRCVDTLAEIFSKTTDTDPAGLPERDPRQDALILLSLFSGLVLWEESKRALDPRKDFLKATLDVAFDIFGRGIAR
jgi:AcrR family transcriptional regulator